LIVFGAIVLFHWKIGPLKIKEEPTGRLVERFTPLERSAHWANVAAFVTLAVSGVVMAFGKFFLLPVIGTTLFGWLTYALKNAHNFAGPLFAVSLLIVIVTFARDNFPAKGDLNWLLKGGGILSGHEIESGRYNAGEKTVFWGGVFVLGLTVVLSGLAMDKLLPGLTYERSTMQMAHMVHSVSNILMLVMMMGHIYMGTLGTKGSLDGMRTGYVDETWAEQHHKLWHDDIKSGKIPAQRSNAAASTAPSGKPVQV
jgi:formate dehydrogenase subunit gamma